MPTLVTYFSAEGTTAKVAKEFAQSISADVFEIVPEQLYTAADIKWTNPLARCNREQIGGKDVPTYVYDGSPVMGNLMNAAESLGVASIWIHRAKEEFDSEFGKDLLKKLGIDGNFEGIGHCALGYAAEPAKAAAPRKENYVYYAE